MRYMPLAMSRPVPEANRTAHGPYSSLISANLSQMRSYASSQLTRSHASLPRSSRARLIG